MIGGARRRSGNGRVIGAILAGAAAMGGVLVFTPVEATIPPDTTETTTSTTTPPTSTSSTTTPVVITEPPVETTQPPAGTSEPPVETSDPGTTSEPSATSDPATSEPPPESTDIVESTAVDTTEIPADPVPAVSKTWSGGFAFALSAEPSTITLGVGNASSASTVVDSLTVTDVDADTFEHFDVTTVGAVTYPMGANTLAVEVCTVPGGTCAEGDWQADVTFAAASPTDPQTIDADPAAVTGIRFTFTNSAGTPLPSGQAGVVDVGVVLRDTVRSSGEPFEPAEPHTITNCATSSLVTTGQTVTSNEACADYTVETDGGIVIQQVVAQVSKDVSQDVVQPGDEFGYTITANCSSLTEACVDATLVDVIPPQWEVTSIPGDTSQREVTYDEATRTLTVVFIIPVPCPDGSSGCTGLPPGGTQQIPIGVRVPEEPDPENPVSQGQVVTNTATMTEGPPPEGCPPDPVTDPPPEGCEVANVDVTVDIPVDPVPATSKSWTDGSAIALSGEASTITLGVRNASSVSTIVDSLTVTDNDPDTFEHFNVTTVGPVTYPAGADTLTVEVCTAPDSACPPGAWEADSVFAAPEPTAAVAIAGDPDDVTGIRFTFTDSSGDPLPYDPTGGSVDVGMELRDTLRSDGSPIQPTERLDIENCASPSLVHEGDPPDVTGDAACAPYSIVPNITTVDGQKSFYADHNGDFSPDGVAVLEQNSPIGIDVVATNTSPFAVEPMSITEPSTATPNEFAKVDIFTVRVQYPADATGATLAVTCRDGSTPAPQPVADGATVPTGCPDGVAAESITVTFTGPVQPDASATISFGGNLNDQVVAGDVGDGVLNCATVDVQGPPDSTGSATADGCDTLPVETPNPDGGGNKNSGQVDNLVPGQPLTFNLQFTNNGNVPLDDIVIYDPPDPTSADNPFLTVRLDSGNVNSPVPYQVDLYDPDVGDYVPFDGEDAALLERSLGFRITLLEPLQPGQTIRFSYTVFLRDGVDPDDAPTFTNCVHVDFVGPDEPGTADFCNNNPIIPDPGSTSASVQKLFAPAILNEPVAGLPPQTSLLQLRVQNNGSLNVSRLVVTDVDADFFDSVDITGNFVVNVPPGANQAQLDVCTSPASCTAGTFVTGSPVSAGNNTTLAIPGGVAPADVVGFRVTFDRADGDYLLVEGSNYPSGGGCPDASICAPIVLRETLRSDPATPIPTGPLADTASAGGESVQQDPGTLFPIPDTTATLDVVPGTPALDIDKSPESRIAPGETAPINLEVENTGTALVPDPVVIDPIPDGLVFDTNFPGGTPGNPYSISFELPEGEPEPTDIVYTELQDDPSDPNRITAVQWEFPGWNMPVGAKVFINFQVTLEAGLAAGTEVTNTAGVTSSDPEFECSLPDDNDGVVVDDPLFGDGQFCTSDTIVTSLAGTAFSSSKWVSGDESLGLVYTLDSARPRVPLDDPRCPQLTVAGQLYTRYPCAAVVLAGNQFNFLLRLTNASNNAISDTVDIVDRLPEVGDTGVILTDDQRATEWDPRPTLTSGAVLVGSGSFLNTTTEYSTSGTPCTDMLFDPNVVCPAGSYEQGGAFNAETRSFHSQVMFREPGLAPGASFNLRFFMRAPADVADEMLTPIAWNSFAHADELIELPEAAPASRVQGFFYVQQATFLGATEPIKAGVAIPYGVVEVSKEEVDPPPGVILPPYQVTFECNVNGTVVAEGTEEVVGGGSFQLPFVPVGAECTIQETFTNGATPPPPVTITIEDGTTPENPQEVVLENVYPQGFLELTKSVTGDGVGLPLASGGAWGDGPFTVIVDCEFPAGGSSLAGYPQLVQLTAGEMRTFGPLPVGAVCTLTELIDAGATAPTFTVDGVPQPPTVPASAQVTISDSDTSTVEVDPNGSEIVNPFLLTELLIIKNIEGEGAELATLDFVFRIDCVQLTRRFEPIFVTMDRPEQSEVLVEGLPVGALCTVFEIDDGGADEEGIRLVGVVFTTPSNPEDPLTIDATNTFSAGQLVLGKVVDGPGAAAALGFEYELLVECERPLNDGTFEPFLSETVTVAANTVTPVDALIPIGSRCWATETDTAGATSAIVDFDSPDNAAIITFETPMITITATNTYDIGELVIEKVVEGDRAGGADQPFTFAVDCTLAGAAQPTVTVTITPPETSVTVPGLSTGAECTITETDAGGADAPAVVEPSSVVIGTAEQPPVTVTATNTFTYGALQITKVIEGIAVEDVTATFVFAVDCTFDGETLPTRTVTITPPTLVATIDDLPAGAVCAVTETDAGGATGPNSVTPEQVTIGADAEVVEVTATNTFTDTGGGGGSSTSTTSTTAPASTTTTPGSLPVTGSSLVAPIVGIASAFVVAGLALAAMLAVRHQGRMR